MIGLVFALMFAADWTGLIPAIEQAVPRMEIQKAGQGGVCSAVVFEVDKDGFAHAISAAHCYDRQPNERIDVTANGRNAVVIHTNTIIDLAILRFRARGEIAVPLAAKSPTAGAEVVIAGFAFGIEKMAVQFGRVSQALNSETKAMLVDGMIVFGDSGGPVLSETGELVGINSRVYFGGMGGQAAHLAGIVPIEAVRDFLDDFRDRQRKR